MRLADLAHVLGAACDRDPDLEITSVAGIEEAGPGQLTFVANPKYAPLAKTTRASAVLVNNEFPEIPAAALRTANPYLAFARAIEIFYHPPEYRPGIHPTAVVDPTATIGANAHIGAYVVIGAGSELGDSATLLPHVVIYPNVRIGSHFFAHAHAVVREGCTLGDHVILQNGAVIGCDGFGFAKEADGRWYKIMQSGPVAVEDHVEVQANSCIDRASVGRTHIGRGVKIDNLVQVGHGSSVGENTLLCSQVGLAGSTHVGKNVVLAGQVGVAGHCTIGDGVIATGQTGLHGDIPPGKILSGSPAMDNRRWLRATSLFSRLPEILKQVQKAGEGS
ncbi:MAG TPA: UDP-3-O-(3-hydroxymyristoyl)glucosamine N-acyltransferase [Acidobacteriaceae bacterium]|nr:UDP-3-O-(3-hydroxymyristoyl)glucosamine N-acyltransferase [Acidobacteriaceae bacterium]